MQAYWAQFPRVSVSWQRDDLNLLFNWIDDHAGTKSSGFEDRSGTWLCLEQTRGDYLFFFKQKSIARWFKIVWGD